MIAFAVDPLGLVVAFYPNNEIFNTNSGLDLYKCNPSNISAFFNSSNIVGIYYNQYIKNFLFTTISFPASVIEYNIGDPYNIYPYKMYALPEGESRFVGTNTIAVNYNYVVHLLVDIIQFQEVIRAYCRNSTRHSLVKFEYILP